MDSSRDAESELTSMLSASVRCRKVVWAQVSQVKSEVMKLHFFADFAKTSKSPRSQFNIRHLAPEILR